MNLPHPESVEIAEEKIVDYLLNPLHPDGAGKAAFFASQGFAVARWQVLADALRNLATSHAVTNQLDSPHGTKYVVEGELTTPAGKTPMVRTVWIVDLESDHARLVTAYPLEGGG